MLVDDEEKAMLVGEAGKVAQIATGDFFAARDFMPVTQARITGRYSEPRQSAGENHRRD